MNEMISPKTPQNPQNPYEEGDLSNIDIRSSVHILTQLLASKVSRDAMVLVNPNANTTT